MVLALQRARGARLGRPPTVDRDDPARRRARRALVRPPIRPGTGRRALVAAVVYQLSPYVLPYVSRTSVLLLPWAGLGWLVGLTMAAARRGGWRDPALFALVVATVGGINATAMAMIAPAPLLWLADAALRRELDWRRAIVTAPAARRAVDRRLARGGWSPSSVQAAFGAPVLNYTETLESVSFTSVVCRGACAGSATGCSTCATRPVR